MHLVIRELLKKKLLNITGACVRPFWPLLGVMTKPFSVPCNPGRLIDPTETIVPGVTTLVHVPQCRSVICQVVSAKRCVTRQSPPSPNGRFSRHFEK